MHSPANVGGRSAGGTRQPKLDSDLVERIRKERARNLLDRELVEKIVLVSLVSIIFGRMLPDVDASPLAIAAGVGVVIVINAAISDWLIRRARQLGYHTTTRQFIGTLAVMYVLDYSVDAFVDPRRQTIQGRTRLAVRIRSTSASTLFVRLTVMSGVRSVPSMISRRTAAGHAGSPPQTLNGDQSLG